MPPRARTVNYSRIVSRYGFIGRDGAFVIEPRFEAVRSFSEGLAPAKLGGRWGYVDVRGDFVIEPAFDDAKPFVCGHGAVQRARKTSYVTRNGVAPWSQLRAPREGLAAVEDGARRWGFVDAAGEVRIEPRFANVKDFSEGLAGANEGGKWGFTDRDGAIVVPPRYDLVDDFREGYATVTRFFDREPAVGLIDRSGNELFAPELGTFIHGVSDGLVRRQIRTLRGGKWVASGFGWSEPNGRVVVEPVHTFIEAFHEGLAAFMDREGDAPRWGFLRRDGSVAIERSFLVAQSFHDDRAWVVDLEGRQHAIDREGVVRVPRADWGLEATPFQHRVSVFTAFDGPAGRPRAGVVRDDGVVLLAREHARVIAYANGLLKFAVGYDDDERWGVMNVDGVRLAEPRFRSLGRLDAELVPAKDEGGAKFLRSDLSPAFTATFVDALAFQQDLAGAAVAAASPTPAEHPFLFYGVRPRDWFDGARTYAIRFAKAPDESTKTALKKTLKSSDVRARWKWKDAIATLVILDAPVSPDLFEDVARAALAMHALWPILEVVNHHARDVGDDAWDRWTLRKQPAPSAGLEDPDGLSVWST